MTPRTRTLAMLAEHGAFLRRLAGGLARSDADADDLVQDTWVSALERPPRAWDAPRGWLGTAARRLSWKRERANGRRAAREARVARAEAVDEPLDAAFVLRDVVDAVLTLEPAQRAVVTARFFEDLSLREIAEREGLSVPAVKGRLRRALEKLRRDLDERHGGDRRAWCVPLLAAAGATRGPVPPVPAGSSSLTLTLATGTLLMSMKLKIALALSAALAVVWGAFSLGAGDAAERVAPAERTSVSAESAVVGAVAPEREESARTSAEAEPEVVPAPAPVERLATLEVHATDQDGVPVSGVHVYAAPPAQPLNHVGKTDASGRCDVRWAPAGAVGELVVQLRSRNHDLTGLRRFEVPRDGRRTLRCAIDPALLPQPGEFSFTLVGGGNAYGRLVVDNGSRLINLATPDSAGEPDAPRHRAGPLEPSLEPGLLDGAPRFVSGEVGATAVSGENVSYQVTGFSGEFGASIVTFGNFEAEAAVEAHVRGVVTDRTGRPASGVRIAARRGDEIVARTRSGVDGTYDFGVPVGSLTLLAGVDDESGARKELLTAADDRAVWDPTVDRGLVLAGVARDKEEPLVSGIVRAIHALPGGLWIGAARTSEQGLFALPHCPAQVVAVDVTHPSRLLPLAYHEAVATGGDTWPVAVDLQAYATVWFTPRDEDAHGPLAGELRVWDADGRCGARVPLHGVAGEPVQVHFSPGTWNIALGARGPHWGRSLPLDVAVGEEVDLGALVLETTGWLELAACAEGETLRVLRAGPGGEVLLPRGSVLSSDALLPLPPGAYRVERVAANGEVRSETIELRATQRSTETRGLPGAGGPR